MANLNAIGLPDVAMSVHNLLVSWQESDVILIFLWVLRACLERHMWYSSWMAQWPCLTLSHCEVVPQVYDLASSLDAPRVTMFGRRKGSSARGRRKCSVGSDWKRA